MLRNCCEMMLSILDGNYGWQSEAVAVIVVVVIFNFLAKWLLKKLHRRFDKQKKIWGDSFVQALYAPLSCYTWFFAVVYAINLMIPKEYSSNYLKNTHMLLAIAAILSLAWFILRWKKTLIRLVSIKSKMKEIAIDQGRLDVIDKVITVFVVFLTIMMLLEVSDRSMNTLIAFGGIGGLAIAFASQEIIANFFGGLMIYVTHPFTIGDWIKLPEKEIEGYVEEIGWYMTRVRTFEKRPIYVPNSTFTKVIVMNPSRMSHRQFKERIGLRYSDLKLIPPVIDDLCKMLQNHPDVARDQKISVYLENFGQHALEVLVSAYTISIESEEYAAVRQDILLKILDVLSKHGAEMASPITTVEIPNGITMKNEQQ